jgi:hypothetical protein
VSALPEANTPGGCQTGVTAEGIAAAAVPEPERGSHEVEWNLGRVERPESEGTAAAVPSVRLHWLA